MVPALSRCQLCAFTDGVFTLSTRAEKCTAAARRVYSSPRAPNISRHLTLSSQQDAGLHFSVTRASHHSGA